MSRTHLLFLLRLTFPTIIRHIYVSLLAVATLLALCDAAPVAPLYLAGQPW